MAENGESGERASYRGQGRAERELRAPHRPSMASAFITLRAVYEAVQRLSSQTLEDLEEDSDDPLIDALARAWLRWEHSYQAELASSESRRQPS